MYARLFCESIRNMNLIIIQTASSQETKKKKIHAHVRAHARKGTKKHEHAYMYLCGEKEKSQKNRQILVYIHTMRARARDHAFVCWKLAPSLLYFPFFFFLCFKFSHSRRGVEISRSFYSGNDTHAK